MGLPWEAGLPLIAGILPLFVQATALGLAIGATFGNKLLLGSLLTCAIGGLLLMGGRKHFSHACPTT